MSFLVASALAIGLLVGLPIAAHLLRRGRAKTHEFPPTALVPKSPPVAQQRTRLEDRLLFSTRALMIVLLALLGATPFVRCSRLSLDRSSGASVALAIVVDDSLSMRARSEGRSRWDRAIEGAQELLGSAREGDAVAIVLAGHPARLALSATTDLGAARAALDELQPSDRSTDLRGAVGLARSALSALRHVDKRVVVLSDLAGTELPEGEPPVWTPLDSLRQPVGDCGIANAEQRGRTVSVVVACSTPDAARGRKVEIRYEGDSNPKDELPAPGELLVRAGVQTVALEVRSTSARYTVQLTGRDALAHDDSAPVAPHAAALSVAVVSDPALGSVQTGGPTVIEQALEALDLDATVRPLVAVPDERSDLDAHAALILDDPAGIGADARFALKEWLERGGVALLLLGPRSGRAQLGSTFEPFADGAIAWEKTEATGIEADSLTWLGPSNDTLGDLAARGRASLGGALPKSATVVGRWSDERPFLVRGAHDRGTSLTAGLPSSVDQSDFALRPAFLAMLEHTVTEARRRSGPRRTVAGAPWSFPGKSPVAVEGPTGPLELREPAACESGDCPEGQRIATPTLRGRYSVRIGNDEQSRTVTIDPREMLRQPRAANGGEARAAQGGTRALVDASPELALVLLGLFAAELALRALRRRQPATA